MEEKIQAISAQRKLWNERQKELRSILHCAEPQVGAFELWLHQHAVLHSGRMDPNEAWSFEDDVVTGLSEQRKRRIPKNMEHSIAWNIWHIARIEDVAMNVLVAGEPQILQQDHWYERLGVPFRDTGNAMSVEDVLHLSTDIALEDLHDYRLAVGLKTRAIVARLRWDELMNPVEPSRLRQVLDEGAVKESARGVVEYWSRRTIAGLLLMPPTRHCFIHLNEALQISLRR